MNGNYINNSLNPFSVPPPNFNPVSKYEKQHHFDLIKFKFHFRGLTLGIITGR